MTRSTPQKAVSSKGGGEAPPVNVLFVSVDQWPASLLGCAGHPVIQTPTLDHLARLGTRFNRAYSESPICIPARRTMMTGLSPRAHGDRIFKPALTMPDVPLLAQTFREAGYQTQAVGKLHVYPPRDRIGFDDVRLAEEGRPKLGAIDDYEVYLSEQGHAGAQFMHGMNNNDYMSRAWHLPEALHVTNWITRETAKVIKRRDPTRPSFWHVSYTHPHPPLAPLQAYLDLYRDLPIDGPVRASWQTQDNIPALQAVRRYWQVPDQPHVHRLLRQAFYALCTHVDHQLRIVWGTLREENLLDNTVVLVTADHGDMLGHFGLWAKRLFYEGSSAVPMILVGAAGDRRVKANHVDPRLVGLQDIMPTLLELAQIPIPKGVEGLSMVSEQRREFLYGECREDDGASRMLHDGRYKLIWYPAGNHLQLFDLESDPLEQVNLAAQAEHQADVSRLSSQLIRHLNGVDLQWVREGRLIGYPFEAPPFVADRAMSGQRGLHFPQPPMDPAATMVGAP